MSKNNPFEFFQSFMNQENLAKSMKWMPCNLSKSLASLLRTDQTAIAGFCDTVQRAIALQNLQWSSYSKYICFFSIDLQFINPQWDYARSSGTKFDKIFTLFKHSGIPPPGCTLPPQKYSPLIYSCLLFDSFQTKSAGTCSYGVNSYSTSAIWLVFPHQLFAVLPPGVKQVVLVEEALFFHQYGFHKQKLVFHRASMKRYESQLIEQDRKSVV